MANLRIGHFCFPQGLKAPLWRSAFLRTRLAGLFLFEIAQALEDGADDER